RERLRRKNANTIAQFIWDEVVTRHGCFAVLVSDRGTEFKNNVLMELATHLNVNQRFVASYHPEANGRAELYGHDAITPIQLMLETYQRMVEDLRNTQMEKDELRQQWKEIHDRKSKKKETYEIGDF
ncbi:1058_t:CDS:2, partial [Ambispora leptoticha]